MSILLFASAVVPCCVCADSFVDTVSLVVLESKYSSYFNKRHCVKMSRRNIKNLTPEFMVDILVLVLPGGRQKETKCHM